MVVVVAHCPADGVKVYCVIAWLLIAGDHVPVIPLRDVFGRVKVPFSQIALTGVKDGVVGVVIFTKEIGDIPVHPKEFVT